MRQTVNETDVDVTVRVDDDLPPMTMATDVVLLRAAQEAFANIRKHAHASAVAVELSSSNGGVRLTVSDNGIGLTDWPTEGFGLRGMRTRVAQVGGVMTVSPTSGRGTTLTVEVPAMTTTVLLVDDHPVVREGLRGMIDAEPDLAVVGEAGSGAEAVAMAEAPVPTSF